MARAGGGWNARRPIDGAAARRLGGSCMGQGAMLAKQREVGAWGDGGNRLVARGLMIGDECRERRGPARVSAVLGFYALGGERWVRTGKALRPEMW